MSSAFELWGGVVSARLNGVLHPLRSRSLSDATGNTGPVLPQGSLELRNLKPNRRTVVALVGLIAKFVFCHCWANRKDCICILGRLQMLESASNGPPNLGSA